MRDVFNSLDLPSLSGGHTATYSVRELRNGVLLGRSIRGNPTFIFVPQALSESQPAGRRLRHLTVAFRLHCTLQYAGGQRNLPGAAVVECIEASEVLRDYFLEVVGAACLRLPVGFSEADVSALIDGLCELFRLVGQPATRSAMGLWAELFLICEASNPLALLVAWHLSNPEQVDFSTAVTRLDVKGTSQPTRYHHFTYEQVYPPVSCLGFIASMFVRPSSAGLPLGELWERARGIAQLTEDPLKVDRLCIDALGDTWDEARQLRYDFQAARQSLRVFSAAEIPRIPEVSDPAISEIKFASDISTSNALSNPGNDSLLLALPSFAFGPATL
jgi:hypothetical protein